MNRIPFPLSCFRILVSLLAISACSWPSVHSQQAPKASQEKSEAKPADKKSEAAPENPAQIELLETRIRFEENGDSRKEVHAHVKINSELGVRQFARLNFDYNRSFESVDIPLVRVSHAHGGTSDVLPSAITDNPNPAVINAPAYQDVRVKSVRILGLAPGDSLDYRVITTVSHHPLAPDFWLDHTFDRTGVVSHEIFDIDLPLSRKTQIHVNPLIPQISAEKSESIEPGRDQKHWDIHGQKDLDTKPNGAEEGDVSVTTFQSWDALEKSLKQTLESEVKPQLAIQDLAKRLVGSLKSDREKVQALYDFVCQKIETVDLPLGATGFKSRSLSEIVAAGRASPEDKFVLFRGLALSVNLYPAATAAFVGSTAKLSNSLPTPSLLSQLLIITEVNPKMAPGMGCGDCEQRIWLYPAVSVAPLDVVPANIRGKEALTDARNVFARDPIRFLTVPRDLPFLSTQTVNVAAQLTTDGTLTAKVKYVMRGDNELLLRVAFHQTEHEKWSEVAQLLALSDGFRGKVTRVSASDPTSTRDPFTVEYEITQPKFVDWSKKPVRIPALLPQMGLPDPPLKPSAGAAVSPIEFGTLLEVETTMTLVLPPNTTAQAPVGETVGRDYATFRSKYSKAGSTLNAYRYVRFLKREIPGVQSADYNAFLRAVQNDAAQDFTLERPDTSPAKTNSAAPNPAAPPNTTPSKP